MRLYTIAVPTRAAFPPAPAAVALAAPARLCVLLVTVIFAQSTPGSLVEAQGFYLAGVTGPPPAGFAPPSAYGSYGGYTGGASVATPVGGGKRPSFFRNPLAAASSLHKTVIAGIRAPAFLTNLLPSASAPRPSIFSFAKPPRGFHALGSTAATAGGVGGAITSSNGAGGGGGSSTLFSLSPPPTGPGSQSAMGSTDLSAPSSFGPHLITASTYAIEPIASGSFPTATYFRRPLASATGSNGGRLSSPAGGLSAMQAGSAASSPLFSTRLRNAYLSSGTPSLAQSGSSAATGGGNVASLATGPYGALSPSVISALQNAQFDAAASSLSSQSVFAGDVASSATNVNGMTRAIISNSGAVSSSAEFSPSHAGSQAYGNRTPPRVRNGFLGNSVASGGGAGAFGNSGSGSSMSSGSGDEQPFDLTPGASSPFDASSSSYAVSSPISSSPPLSSAFQTANSFSDLQHRLVSGSAPSSPSSPTSSASDASVAVAVAQHLLARQQQASASANAAASSLMTSASGSSSSLASPTSIAGYEIGVPIQLGYQNHIPSTDTSVNGLPSSSSSSIGPTYQLIDASAPSTSVSTTGQYYQSVVLPATEQSSSPSASSFTSSFINQGSTGGVTAGFNGGDTPAYSGLATGYGTLGNYYQLLQRGSGSLKSQYSYNSQPNKQQSLLSAGPTSYGYGTTSHSPTRYGGSLLSASSSDTSNDSNMSSTSGRFGGPSSGTSSNGLTGSRSIVSNDARSPVYPTTVSSGYGSNRPSPTSQLSSSSALTSSHSVGGTNSVSDTTATSSHSGNEALVQALKAYASGSVKYVPGKPAVSINHQLHQQQQQQTTLGYSSDRSTATGGYSTLPTASSGSSSYSAPLSSKSVKYSASASSLMHSPSAKSASGTTYSTPVKATSIRYSTSSSSSSSSDGNGSSGQPAYGENVHAQHYPTSSQQLHRRSPYDSSRTLGSSLRFGDSSASTSTSSASAGASSSAASSSSSSSAAAAAARKSSS